MSPPESLTAWHRVNGVATTTIYTSKRFGQYAKFGCDIFVNWPCLAAGLSFVTIGMIVGSARLVPSTLVRLAAVSPRWPLLMLSWECANARLKILKCSHGKSDNGEFIKTTVSHFNAGTYATTKILFHIQTFYCLSRTHPLNFTVDCWWKHPFSTGLSISIFVSD